MSLEIVVWKILKFKKDISYLIFYIYFIIRCFAGSVAQNGLLPFFSPSMLGTYLIFIQKKSRTLKN
jgi:hypothetical protein